MKPEGTDGAHEQEMGTSLCVMGPKAQYVGGEDRERETGCGRTGCEDRAGIQDSPRVNPGGQLR